jgi:putative flippase GtrA
VSPAAQVVRFLVVGGGATVVDVGLFNVLDLFAGTGPLAAKSLSTVTSAVIAFVGNRQWSFASGRGVELRHQVMRYVAVNASALVIALVPIAVAHSLLGLDGVLQTNLAANVVGLAMATWFRFHAYRRWVFPPPERRPVVASRSG